MLYAFKRHPFIAFYTLAFILAWMIKIPVAISDTNNIVLRLLPSFVPALAAIITTAIIAGKRGVGGLCQSIGKVKVSPIWYVATLLGPIILELLSVMLSTLLGNPFPAIDFPGIRLLPVVLLAIFFALGEELGWRGFALPRFQRRYSALIASMLIGLLWWLWHIPDVLSAIGNYSLTQIIMVELWSLLQSLALSVLMTWVYNSTDGSVILVTLIHVGNGILGQIMAIPGGSLTSNLYNIILTIVAIIVIITTGPAHLTHKRVTRADETSQPGAEERARLQGSRT